MSKEFLTDGPKDGRKPKKKDGTSFSPSIEAYLQRRWEEQRARHLSTAKDPEAREYRIKFTNDEGVVCLSGVNFDFDNIAREWLEEFEEMFGNNGPVSLVQSEWRDV
jgi:hypothetical protein